eukprot:4420802-Amphidinium_carterae.1
MLAGDASSSGCKHASMKLCERGSASILVATFSNFGEIDCSHAERMSLYARPARKQVSCP